MDAPPPPDEPLMSTAELARYLNVSIRAVERLRAERTGPPFVTFGRRIRYRQPDVDAWLARSTICGPR